MKLGKHNRKLIIKLVDNACASGDWGKADTKRLNSLKRRMVASLNDTETAANNDKR